VRGETINGHSAKMVSLNGISRVANTPMPIVDVDFTVYDLLPGGFGMGCGYPGALSTLFLVGPLTIHSVCPPATGGSPMLREGMVVITSAFG